MLHIGSSSRIQRVQDLLRECTSVELQRADVGRRPWLEDAVAPLEQSTATTLIAPGVRVVVDLPKARLRYSELEQVLGIVASNVHSATAVPRCFLEEHFSLELFLRMVAFGHVVYGWEFLDGPLDVYLARILQHPRLGWAPHPFEDAA